MSSIQAWVMAMGTSPSEWNLLHGDVKQQTNKQKDHGPHAHQRKRTLGQTLTRGKGPWAPPLTRGKGWWAIPLTRGKGSWAPLLTRGTSFMSAPLFRNEHHWMFIIQIVFSLEACLTYWFMLILRDFLGPDASTVCYTISTEYRFSVLLSETTVTLAT